MLVMIDAGSLSLSTRLVLSSLAQSMPFVRIEHGL